MPVYVDKYMYSIGNRTQYLEVYEFIQQYTQVSIYLFRYIFAHFDVAVYKFMDRLFLPIKLYPSLNQRIQGRPNKNIAFRLCPPVHLPCLEGKNTLFSEDYSKYLFSFLGSPKYCSLFRNFGSYSEIIYQRTQTNNARWALARNPLTTRDKRCSLI